MQHPGHPDPQLDAIAAADRVARAAGIWLRREVAIGSAPAIGTRAHRELASGLVARLCEILELGRPVALLAGYAVALLESEVEFALEVSLEIAAGSSSQEFLRGERAADALVMILVDSQAPGSRLSS